MSAHRLVWVVVVIGVLGIILSCGNLQKLSQNAREKTGEEEQGGGEEQPAAAKPQPQTQQPPAPQAQVPEKPAGALETEAQKVLVQKAEEFVYDPINKTDPFQPFKPQVVAEQQVPTAGLPQTEYMSRYELRSLRLVAIAWGSVEPRAMFETPDGKAYSVKVGDVFSKDAAEVLSIAPEGVSVQVSTRAITGEVVTQKIDIRLKPEELEREEAESFLGFGGKTRKP